MCVYLPKTHESSITAGGRIVPGNAALSINHELGHLLNPDADEDYIRENYDDPFLENLGLSSTRRKRER